VLLTNGSGLDLPAVQDGLEIFTSRDEIYSASRPMQHSECGHLPLNTLSRIARQVREVTGLKAEVF